MNLDDCAEIVESKIETHDVISPLFKAFCAELEKIPKATEKEQLTFLENGVPDKLKRMPKNFQFHGAVNLDQGEKKRKDGAEGEKKRKRTPVRRSATRVRPDPRRYPNVITSSVSREYGIADSFAVRAGIDPRISAKDVRLEEIGKGGGSFVKQEQRRYRYDDWDAARSHQTQEWRHIIWLDPSAPAAIIHPADTFLNENVKVVKGRCPTKIDLAKEFGTGVEYIYLSPPWDSPNFGNGKRGYFTLEHLKNLNFKRVQRKGFIFMWLPFSKMVQIKNVMREKGYNLVDSCGALLCDFQGGVLTSQRNPHAKKNSSKKEDIVGRMAGMSLKGVLWKKFDTKEAKERFRIGNQIIYDCFQWRKKTDQYTGQFLPDHGYAYELYQYLMVQKPKNSETIHALHLWCRPGLQVKNFAGVQYFPEYDHEKQCMKEATI